jgi:cytosine/uracil/thiamine/allantoin permease
MSKIKIQLVEDEQETPSVSEWMWSSLMTFAKCVGVFAAICFAIGYFSSTKQAQAKQCEPSKTVLARSIFK